MTGLTSNHQRPGFTYQLIYLSAGSVKPSGCVKALVGSAESPEAFVPDSSLPSDLVSVLESPTATFHEFHRFAVAVEAVFAAASTAAAGPIPNEGVACFDAVGFDAVLPIPDVASEDATMADVAPVDVAPVDVGGAGVVTCGGNPMADIAGPIDAAFATALFADPVWPVCCTAFGLVTAGETPNAYAGPLTPGAFIPGKPFVGIFDGGIVIAGVVVPVGPPF